MILRVTVGLLGAIFLSGCATEYTYTAQPGIQAATVKLPLKPPPLLLTAPADAECPKATIDPTKGEIQVAPGQRRLLELGYSKAGAAFGTECIVTLSFVPGAGKEYSLLYEATLGGCAAGLLTRDESGRLVREPSVKKEEFTRCLY